MSGQRARHPEEARCSPASPAPRCLRYSRWPHRSRRPAGHRHHVVSEGTDRGLQEGVRGEEPRDEGRDPEQGHPGRRRLRARDARRQPARRLLGLGARRVRGAREGRPARRSTTPASVDAGQDRQLPDQRPAGLLPRPGARRLRDHVEHALPEGEQAARRRRSGPTWRSRSTSATWRCRRRRARAPPT